MEEESNGLAPWILLPLILLVVVIVVAWISIPALSEVCAEAGGDDDGGGPVVWIVVALCSLAVGGAGLMRLTALWRSSSFSERDVWISAIALTSLAVLAGIFSNEMSVLAGLLLAGLILAALAFVGLLIAAIMEREADDVGLLLPVYLVTLGFFAYPLFGLAAADANLGGLC